MTNGKTCENCRHKKRSHNCGKFDCHRFNNCTCKKFEGEDGKLYGDFDIGESSGSDFCLSDLIFKCGYARSHYGCPVIHRDNIRKFIKQLKRFIQDSAWIDKLTKQHFKANVDKLAGKELSK